MESEIVVEELEELHLHEVDFGTRETKELADTVNVLDMAVGVRGPPLVLGTRIVEVLGGNDERGDEYAVASARHPSFGHLGKLVLEAVEINERCKERRGLHVRPPMKKTDEILQ